jgi:hypothetical protein
MVACFVPDGALRVNNDGRALKKAEGYQKACFE